MPCGTRFIKVQASLLLNRTGSAPSHIHPADLPDLVGRFGIDLIAEPELTPYILERITAFCWEYAQRFFAAAPGKIHITQVTDDYGSQQDLMISAASYRQWFKPRQAAVIAAARAVRPNLPVCYHSDGNCWDIIPDLIEIGVTVLNPVRSLLSGLFSPCPCVR
jgi:uroporphyrinogen-III decarboxylase